MTPNVGTPNRVIRAVVGLALVAWAPTGGRPGAWIGVLPFAIGAFRFCPAYRLLG